ncbi:MAG: hypothetical protein B2I17_01995 [Thermoplasmatales archaeon B_DKE]|nr:MAG: hypothetical protein B2I17_01995 [Thermoplasmatales archaeon B_DKE]
MRLRKYIFMARRVITFNLGNFGMGSSTTVTVNIVDLNILVVRILSGDVRDLLHYRNSTFQQCVSSNCMKNGTFIRTPETWAQIRIQRYKCNDSLFSTESGPPNHGYCRYILVDTKDISVSERFRTSLRKQQNSSTSLETLQYPMRP